MGVKLGKSLNRRTFLAGTATGVGLLASPSILRASDRQITVGTFGGLFQDSFDEHIFPEFTKATGIKVNSIAAPTSEVWLVQIANAARANKAPADVSLMAGTPITQGVRQNLFKPLDLSKMPNVGNVAETFFERGADGQTFAVGCTAWYLTLCTNTDTYPEAPTSWKTLWDKQNAGNIGVVALLTSSFLLEMTATVYFGGTKILDTREGIETVFDKIAEMVPNVRLWYRDEGQFQQALQSGEIPMGQYFHDVTLLAAKSGFPVRSTFPSEGGVIQFGSWVVANSVTAVDESMEFINYTCDPAVQALLSRNVSTAPVVDRAKTGLTDEEFAAVSSDIPPIVPRYDIYLDHGEWINQRWTTMISE